MLGEADRVRTRRGRRGGERVVTGLPSEPLSPRAARIHAALHDAILYHRLQPGARLPEDEIGSIYGASRTIVRSALQALAHERLVTIEPNRGAWVAKPTAEEARQVFEARSIIEPRVAAMAATRVGDGDATWLARHVREESEAVAVGETSRAITLSADFHRKICEIAAQPILSGFVHDLLSRSSLIVALYWRRPDTMCERHAHAALAEAIIAQNGARAADLMLSHIVDLLSGLDLRPRLPGPMSLAQALGGRKPATRR